jgi:transposase
VAERFGITLSRSSCLNDLHRLGFVVKRPKKRLLKADDAKREVFVAEYAALRVEAEATGAQHFFVDEAHFYADVDRRGKGMLKGTPAPVDSTSPRYGHKANSYAAVCVETGEVEALPLAGNSTADTSVSFLQQLRAHHAAPLVVFSDNAPVHGGDPIRDYLATPDLHLRLVRLPAYSPAFNAAEHIWDWVRTESPPTPAAALRPTSARTSIPSSSGSRPVQTRSSAAAAPCCRPRPTPSTWCVPLLLCTLMPDRRRSLM